MTFEIKGVWLRFFDDRVEVLVDGPDNETRLALTVTAQDARGAHFVSGARAVRGPVVDVDLAAVTTAVRSADAVATSPSAPIFNLSAKAKVRTTAAALLAVTSTALNPSPDVAGCPDAVARLAVPAALRAYADGEHHFGEGFAQRVDYGTGVEHDAVCVCGASWGEDGCTERDRLLAIAQTIERGECVDNSVDKDLAAAGTSPT